MWQARPVGAARAIGLGVGLIRRLRLSSGLVMFAYVTTHFVNHSLGLVSVQLMDQALERIYAVWASVPGTILLYGSFSIHYGLALLALWRRRTLRIPAAEAVQLVLGFCIPFLLVEHVVSTRVAEQRRHQRIDVMWMATLCGSNGFFD